MARQAVELFNGGQEGAKKLQKSPSLVALLVEMHRAQGTEASPKGILASVSDREEEDLGE